MTCKNQYQGEWTTLHSNLNPSLFSLSRTLKECDIYDIDEFLHDFVSQDLGHDVAQSQFVKNYQAELPMSPVSMCEHPVSPLCITSPMLSHLNPETIEKDSFKKQKKPPTGYNVPNSGWFSEFQISANTTDKCCKKRVQSNCKKPTSWLYQNAEKLDLGNFLMTKCPYCPKLFQGERGFLKHVVKEHKVKL
ncbi:hypothetical protein HDV06_006318 [Boothiomyces sp. JEL0866]|nr:hypothetical protein HDV06_006318 [Boothiomyces sp. JEL0866]